jgi:Tellurite resistance protein TerB
VIIVWGFKVRYSDLRNVHFACPKCGVDQDGTVRRARRWFTLFWLPLVALKDIGHFVQCHMCNGKFDCRVLDAPTTGRLAEHLVAAKRYGVAAMVRVAANGPASRASAISVMGADIDCYDDAQLDVDLANTDDANLEAWLAHLSGLLTPQGKETLISELVAVARADGPIDAAEQTLLERCGSALGLTPAHLQGVLIMTATNPGLLSNGAKVAENASTNPS